MRQLHTTLTFPLTAVITSPSSTLKPQPLYLWPPGNHYGLHRLPSIIQIPSHHSLVHLLLTIHALWLHQPQGSLFCNKKKFLCKWNSIFSFFQTKMYIIYSNLTTSSAFFISPPVPNTLSGTALSWLKSYLLTTTPPPPLLYPTVTQGLVLGSLLFIVYMHLGNVIRHFSI